MSEFAVSFAITSKASYSLPWTNNVYLSYAIDTIFSMYSIVSERLRQWGKTPLRRLRDVLYFHLMIYEV